MPNHDREASLFFPPVFVLGADEAGKFVHHHTHRTSDRRRVFLVVIGPRGDLQETALGTGIERCTTRSVGLAETVIGNLNDRTTGGDERPENLALARTDERGDNDSTLLRLAYDGSRLLRETRGSPSEVRCTPTDRTW